MTIITSKILSYEEELVEYENDKEFLDDIKIRKQNGWSLVCSQKLVWKCYEDKEYKTVPVKKYRYGKNGVIYESYRWKRYGFVDIG